MMKMDELSEIFGRPLSHPPLLGKNKTVAVSSTNRDLPSEENVSTAASQRGGAYRMNTQGGISLTGVMSTCTPAPRRAA